MKVLHILRCASRSFSVVGLLLLHSFSLNAGISTWWKNREAVQCFKDQKYEQALLIYNDLIDKDPYNPEYNYNIGDVLYKQNRYEDARQAFNRAATHATKNLKIGEYAWYGAGNSCYQLKEWQQAIDMYEASLKLNPSNEQTLHNLRLARAELTEEKLKDMQDKLEKNKDKNKDQKKQDQQCGNDQKDQQSGDDSQDSSGSSAGDEKDNQPGKQKGKGEKTQVKKDSGTEKQNEPGQEQGEQENLDKKDKESQNGNGGDEQEGAESQEQNDKKGDDQLQDGSSGEKGDDLEGKLEKNQQNLNDVASQVADQGKDSQEVVEEDGLEENLDGDEELLKKQEQATEIKEEQESAGAQSDKKGGTPAYKKPELRNELKDLFESKSSNDERLDSYYANIMKALEDQEENIQRHVIKNRVAEKVVGQHGKNGW